MSKEYEYIAARGNGKSGMAARDIAKAVRAMENKEWIEKEAAIKIHVRDGYNVDGLLYVPWRDVMDYLRAIPPADVKPVVRGEWIEGEYVGEVGYEIKWHCSSCRFLVLSEEYPTWCFCPSCGADMRKENTHET